MEQNGPDKEASQFPNALSGLLDDGQHKPDEAIIDRYLKLSVFVSVSAGILIVLVAMAGILRYLHSYTDEIVYAGFAIFFWIMAFLLTLLHRYGLISATGKLIDALRHLRHGNKDKGGYLYHKGIGLLRLSKVLLMLSILSLVLGMLISMGTFM